MAYTSSSVDYVQFHDSLSVYPEKRNLVIANKYVSNIEQVLS